MTPARPAYGFEYPDGSAGRVRGILDHKNAVGDSQLVQRVHVRALAEQVQKEGLPAQQRYIGFLKSGGSDYPINILKKAGVDMSTPKPIEVTLHKFSTLLDQLETILAQP